MVYIRLVGLIAATSLIALADARHARPHKHEAVNMMGRRQISNPAAVPATSTQPPVLTTIFPSPGASPVLVTEQSQLVSSYVPQFTLCELPPIEFFPVTLAPSATPTTAPYQNYSIYIPPGNGSCTTIYSPTQTMVCATVLSDLTTTYTVSQCAQDITFSTQYGYSLVTPTQTTTPIAIGASSETNPSALVTAAPSIQTLTTYYLAPWQELTSAGPPGDVDYKICETFENGTVSCILEYYLWRTSSLTLTGTTTTSINFTTTIPGPSQLVVETFVANITETLTTYTMSTTMELETSTLTETTVTSTRPAATGPTVYQTMTVEEVS